MSSRTMAGLMLALVAGCGGASSSTDDQEDAALTAAVTPDWRPAVRSYDGSGNNVAHPTWGAAAQPFQRNTTNGYGDGVSTPGGAGRPNPRAISNAVVAQTALAPNRAHISDLVWQWGQFIDHDLTFTPGAVPAEPLNIPVPTGDALFDPNGTGTQVISLTRSEHVMVNGHREQMNHNTAFVDASMIYGSDAIRAASLRANDGTGMLLTSAGNLLPFNTFGLINLGPGGAMAPNDKTMFIGGDVRVNEQVGLTAMHTLWLREHNRLAKQLGKQNPSWSDEQRYQAARALVIAEVQKITFKDFVPLLFGSLKTYQGYDSTVNPTLENLFAAAMYRVGHTLLSPSLALLGPKNVPISAAGMSLRDAFFTPDQFIAGGMLEPLLRGQAHQVAQEVDNMIVDPVRSFLFGMPGQGGLDLAALNIQRGREQGLPSYSQARANFGLARPQSFEDVSSDPDVQARLASVYASVDDIDPWVGALCEDHVDGALVGELISTVVRAQFSHLRDGDRYYYETSLPSSLVSWANSRTLSAVIRDNTAIGSELQANAFQAP